MRGFPIVSLGAITSSVDTYVEKTPHNATIVIPEFEVEEYFSGNKTSAINKYSGGYYSSNYVESIAIKPNNINASTGDQSIITGSYGFSFDDTQIWINNVYGVKTKVDKIEKYRIDSFYCTSFRHNFLWHSGGQNSKNDYKKDKNIYINVPNLLMFGYHHTFSISLYTEKLYLNIPKIQDFSNCLFNSLNETLEIIFNLIFTNQPMTNVGINAEGNYTISTTSLSNTNLVYSALFNNRCVPPDMYFFRGQMFLGRSNVPLSEFDIRYWDLWQNTTGKDSGLH